MRGTENEIPNGHPQSLSLHDFWLLTMKRRQIYGVDRPNEPLSVSEPSRHSLSVPLIAANIQSDIWANASTPKRPQPHTNSQLLSLLILTNSYKIGAHLQCSFISL